MNREKDQPDDTWGDDDGMETPRTFRDAYLDAINQNQPRSRSRNVPQREPYETPDHPGARARPRGVPGAGRIYEESDEQLSQRARLTRQSHDEALARLRQRPRQSASSEETQARSGAPTKKSGRATPRRAQAEENPYTSTEARGRRTDADAYQQSVPRERGRRSYEDEQYEAYETEQARRKQPPQQVRRRRGRKMASNILVGCLGGLITVALLIAVGAFYLLHNTPLGQNFGKTAYTQRTSQSIVLGHATELIVKNQAGDVAINIDAGANSAGVTSVKKVQASSQSDANKQFSQLVLSTKQIGQGDDPLCTATSCLLVTATLPANNGGSIFGGSSSTIDLALTLPVSFNSPDPATPDTISASSTSGNLTVNGFNGILNLTGNSGNISVAHALIFAGTCLQTMHGDVNVGQGSLFDLNQPSNLIPCSNTTGSGVHPWFNIRSGRGNVEIALNAPSSNLLLDANTNSGQISNEFGTSIPSNSDGSATYHGPLLPNSNPIASLYVFTSTGNIEIRRQ
ncbi:MAG TPA: DUF4097 family beta strand repeat-containing protein [Ktedonobacteraceae bacterium]|nr:DUF4097 family beta strand repeat-containing protein [Ktedonobacteraceae bacterium]